MTRFPWIALFRLALAHGLTPETVWRMTPAHLFALLGVPEETPMLRDELSRLIDQFPDTERKAQ